MPATSTTSPSRFGDRAFDRAAPVELDDVLAFSRCPVSDRVDDRLRIFAARIIVRDVDAVGELRGDRTHFGAFAAIAIAAATEHDDQLRR